MLNIILQPQGRLYRQIYRSIRNDIIEGKLSARERLPSTRALAEYLSVSRSTVQSAYDQLLAEGYIEARPQSGYYVCGESELAYLAHLDAGKKSAEATTVESVRAAAEETHGGWKAADRNLIDFSPRAIDMTYFPYATWKKISREILVDARREMFYAGDPQGDLSLRQTIAHYLQTARGVRLDASQLVVGAGNDYLLMLLQTMLEKDRIAMERTTYRRPYESFRQAGYEVAVVGMDTEGISVKELEASRARLVYVMPAHQYPTGIVMSNRRRMELLSWAQTQPGRFLLEDDYDSEFRYRGKPLPSLQAADAKGCVVYIGTFSKSIAPAIRVSYMVLPPVLLDVYHERCGFLSSTVSRIDQAILNEFIRDGYFERYLNKMRRSYHQKHDRMLAELKELEGELEISGSDAGLHLLLSCRHAGGETAEAFERRLCEAARAAGIKIYGLHEDMLPVQNMSEFPARLQRPTFILGFASPTPEELSEGCRRLKKVWRSVQS